MKIALLGYGKMGRAIHKIALERGHTITAIVDHDNSEDRTSAAFLDADVVIEFTTPSTAVANYRYCLEHKMRVVSGTTGWLHAREEVEQLCREHAGSGFFYASNFSVGGYLFNQVNKRLAELMAARPEYAVHMDEIHHIHKADYPSGTALTLAAEVQRAIPRITQIKASLEPISTYDTAPDTLEIRCRREGEVPGTHSLVYASPIDEITITHEAKGREGFAFGAVLAAEFMCNRTGVYGMDDMMAI